MYIGYCMFYYHHVYFNVDKISRTQIIRETHAPSNATIYHIYDVLYKLFKSQNKVDMLLIFNIFLPFMKIFHNMNPYRKRILDNPLLNSGLFLLRTIKQFGW